MDKEKVEVLNELAHLRQTYKRFVKHHKQHEDILIDNDECFAVSSLQDFWFAVGFFMATKGEEWSRKSIINYCLQQYNV